ncbi:MAG TPA: hypothetical protein VED37_15945 [Ktedonobacteraceae bacterium]|nr:hypothetical protein [Ktedonobacteraceae bacterium]
MTGKIQAQQAREVTKIDLRKEFKQLYSPSTKEEAKERPPGSF